MRREFDSPHPLQEKSGRRGDRLFRPDLVGPLNPWRHLLEQIPLYRRGELGGLYSIHKTVPERAHRPLVLLTLRSILINQLQNVTNLNPVRAEVTTGILDNTSDLKPSVGPVGR